MGLSVKHTLIYKSVSLKVRARRLVKEFPTKQWKKITSGDFLKHLKEK